MLNDSTLQGKPVKSCEADCVIPGALGGDQSTTIVTGLDLMALVQPELALTLPIMGERVLKVCDCRVGVSRLFR